jgi:hypothetical protein
MLDTILILIAIGTTITGICYLIHQIKEFYTMVAASLQHLQEQIEHARTVKERAIELLTYLRDKLDEAAKHPDAATIRALADELRQNTEKLSSAIGKDEEEEGD